ncbi:MAG TPA: type II toxin-antitoxin system RelE/ParE family toxin [Thermoanaerobaculia bacterium]|nr:type II toxin-antitoxin system RelE/ParE family toxin [Thermoanaerobaculia bacterium]
MIRRVIVRREAKQDLREAKAWYRGISRELGRNFVRRIDDAIALARERPLAFQIVHRTFRRILLHRFPYALFYHAGEDRIVVVAVLHQARDPEILETRGL